MVVPEPEGGAHVDPEMAAWQLKNALLRELLAIQGLPLKRLLNARYKRFRRVGQFDAYLKVALGWKVARVEGQIRRSLRQLRGKVPHRPHTAADRQ